MTIHRNYLLLTEPERRLVDLALEQMMDAASYGLIPLGGADPAEHAAEALATWVVTSRRAPLCDIPPHGSVKQNA